MISDVCPAPRYSLRHGVKDKAEPDDFGGASSINSNPNLPAPLDESGKYGFPLCEGGTFMEIAQRAMKDDWILVESANLCHAAGLLLADDIALLKSQYLSVATFLEYQKFFTFSRPLEMISF